MALIVIVVNDTVENGRSALTARAWGCVRDTTDVTRHRLMFSDNASTCPLTRGLLALSAQSGRAQVLMHGENLGVARATNRAWQARDPHEVCIKLDNDVDGLPPGWADVLEDALLAAPELGIVGAVPLGYPLDAEGATRWVRRSPGHPWIGAKAGTVLGLCVAAGPSLIDAIGGMDAIGQYGFDDVLYSHRARLAGFTPSWVPQVSALHADPGVDSAYRTWKDAQVAEARPHFEARARAYAEGTWPLYMPLTV